MPHPHPARDITWDDLKHLRVDRSGRLLWNGSPVATEQRIRLTRWQAIAVIGALVLLAIQTVAIVMQAAAAVFPQGIAFLLQAMG